MQTDPLFSIVIPAYNYAHLLSRAVRSACEQEGSDFDVLVVDDGSTDDTAAVAESLARRFANLKVIHQDNAGPGAARNRGIDESAGRYLIFLDADDELLPGALAIFRRGIDESGGAEVIVAPTVSVFENGKQRLGQPPVIARSARRRFKAYLAKQLRLVNGGVAMKREVFSQVRYNPALQQVEDVPVFAQALANFQCHGVDEPVARIYKHEGSRRRSAEKAESTGYALVEEIFDKGVLPPSFSSYRAEFLALRSLSLFRTHYKAGDYQAARAYYARALKCRKQSILKFSYLRKYLASLFK